MHRNCVDTWFDVWLMCFSTMCTSLRPLTQSNGVDAEIHSNIVRESRALEREKKETTRSQCCFRQWTHNYSDLFTKFHNFGAGPYLIATFVSFKSYANNFKTKCAEIIHSLCNLIQFGWYRGGYGECVESKKKQTFRYTLLADGVMASLSHLNSASPFQFDYKWYIPFCH